MVSKMVKMPRVTAPPSFLNWKAFNMFYLAFVFGLFVRDCAGATDKMYVSDASQRVCVCEGEFNATHDYFPNKVAPDFSQLWEVSYHNSYKIVTNKASGAKMLLNLCGAPVPANPENLQVVDIPILSASIDSSTFIHFFEYVGQRESIGYYDSSKAYVTAACMQKLFDVDFIKDSEDFPLSQAPVDVQFMSNYSYTYNPDKVALRPSFVINADRETTALGQSEWVEVVSLFFNRELAAKDVAQNIDDRFQCNKDAVTTALNGGATRKKVLVFSFGLYQYTPDASCSDFLERSIYGTACPHFNCEFVDAAGGEIFDTNNLVNQTAAALVDAIDDVDVILYTNSWDQIPSQCLATVNDILGGSNAFANNEIYDIYRTVGTSGTYYFEGRLSEPDVYLLDMIKILHPSLATSHERQYFRKVVGPQPETKNQVTGSQCTDPSAPLFNQWTKTACAPPGSEDAVIEGLEGVQAGDVCPVKEGGSPNDAAHPTLAYTAVMMATIVLAYFM